MVTNRKAYHDYTVIEEYIAGIILLGPEVKSIKSNEVSITESYCVIHNGEVFIKNMHIKPYEMALNNTDPIRDRKLLLKKSEIHKLENHLKNKGLTIIPLSVNNGSGKIKVKLGLCKGKKNYDKRNSLKEKDIKKDIERYAKI